MMDFSPPTVLLVNDDAAVSSIVRRHLTNLHLHAQIIEAVNGEQELAFVTAHCKTITPPHSLLVLLDLNRPVMGGLEFLKHFLHLPLHYQQAASVIIIPATPSVTERTRAQALAVEVMPKPLTKEKVAELAHHYLPAAYP